MSIEGSSILQSAKLPVKHIPMAPTLDTTREPVEAVAARVGYADCTAFRRVFRKHTGESPRGRRERQGESA